MMSKKRIFCIVLALALVVCAVPFSVSAYAHDSTKPLPIGIYQSWKQTDPRWSDVVIGKDPWVDSMGVSHTEETVGHAGCMITSMAMLARAYGLTLADGTEIDPGTLAEAMYDGGSCKYLSERGGARYTSAFNELIPGIRYINYLEVDDPVAKATELLSDPNREYLIIFGVRKNGHFVAADHVENGTVVILDPGYSCTLLSEYSVTSMLIFTVDEQYVDENVTVIGEDLWHVIDPDGVKLRKEPGLSGERIGTMACGARFTVSETTELDGYIWGKTESGWCALGTADGKEVFCELEYSSSKYAVTYHAQGGTGAPEKQWKLPETPLTLAEEEPTKKGYVFLGWSKDPSAVSADYVPGSVYEADEPLKLFAVWQDAKEIFAYGIDVSSHQGTVDWKKVAASGIGFVILRAGTSRGKDTTFESNYQGAKQAGLHVGAYMYSYSTTVAGVKEDVAKYTEWLSGKQFDMPVYLDFETSEQAALSAGKLNEIATVALDLLRARGYYCGTYASESWYGTHLSPSLIGTSENLWVAKWTSSGRLSQNLSQQYGLYQYSETGRVDGINGNVDLDVCYVDYPTLIKQQNGAEEPQLLPDRGAAITDGVLYGGRIGLTVADWQTKFDGEVHFSDADGNAMDSDAIVVTGSYVRCGSRTYAVAVRGDLNANNRIDASDFFLLKRGFLGTVQLSTASYYAGCILGNKMTARDYLILKRHVLGTLDLYEVTGTA